MLHETLLLARELIFSFESVGGALVGTHVDVDEADVSRVRDRAEQRSIPLLVERSLGQDRSQS